MADAYFAQWILAWVGVGALVLAARSDDWHRAIRVVTGTLGAVFLLPGLVSLWRVALSIY